MVISGLVASSATSVIMQKKRRERPRATTYRPTARSSIEMIRSSFTSSPSDSEPPITTPSCVRDFGHRLPLGHFFVTRFQAIKGNIVHSSSSDAGFAPPGWRKPQRHVPPSFLLPGAPWCRPAGSPCARRCAATRCRARCAPRRDRSRPVAPRPGGWRAGRVWTPRLRNEGRVLAPNISASPSCHRERRRARGLTVDPGQVARRMRHVRVGCDDRRAAWLGLLAIQPALECDPHPQRRLIVTGGANDRCPWAGGNPRSGRSPAPRCA